jgi:hypothetical protein
MEIETQRVDLREEFDLERYEYYKHEGQKKGRMKTEKKPFSIIGIPKYHSRGLSVSGRPRKLQRWPLLAPVRSSRPEVYFGKSET